MSETFTYQGKLWKVVGLSVMGSQATPGCVYLSLYGFTAANGSAPTWTGDAYRGNIPLAELAQWALERGYLKLEHDANMVG